MALTEPESLIKNIFRHDERESVRDFSAGLILR